MYKYIEIANALETLFKEMNFKPGQRVPSVRDLCKTYNCHQSTAVKALNYLKEQNIVYSIPQSGYYITGRLDSNDETPEEFDFKSASPDSRFFPYMEYQKCVNLAIEKNKSDLFEYGNLNGYVPLKVSISKLLTKDYIFTQIDNIVITSGIQQCLSILTELDFNNERKKVLVEQPTYHCYIDYLKLNGFDVELIDRTFEGLDLVKLEEFFKKGEIKFFYTLARVHNPLGTKLSQREKKKIIELAYRYNVYIVEDDYMADYITDKTNDPLFTYDLKGTHAIYLRSFSKSIFPGLRVGFAVLPKTLVDTFSEKKYYQDMGTSLLSQASLDVYLRNKMYNRHMYKMIKLYKNRAELLRSILTDLNVQGSFRSQSDASIIHTCLDVKKYVSLKKLNQSGIKIADIRKHYYTWNKDHYTYLPLNVSNVSNDRIDTGIRKLLKRIE